MARFPNLGWSENYCMNSLGEPCASLGRNLKPFCRGELCRSHPAAGKGNSLTQPLRQGDGGSGSAPTRALPSHLYGMKGHRSWEPACPPQRPRPGTAAARSGSRRSSLSRQGEAAGFTHGAAGCPARTERRRTAQRGGHHVPLRLTAHGPWTWGGKRKKALSNTPKRSFFIYS